MRQLVICSFWVLLGSAHDLNVHNFFVSLCSIITVLGSGCINCFVLLLYPVSRASTKFAVLSCCFLFVSPCGSYCIDKGVAKVADHGIVPNALWGRGIIGIINEEQTCSAKFLEHVLLLL